MGHLGMSVSIRSFMYIHKLFVAPVLAWATEVCKFPSTRSSECSVNPKIVYKLLNFIQVVSLHWLFYLTELNKDDDSHSSGVFHILVHSAFRTVLTLQKHTYSNTCT